jgi:biotin carboxyl carrier protein
VRYYLVNDGEEIIVDLLKTEKINNDLFSFEFSHAGQKKIEKCLVRHLAGKYYLSTNGFQWNKIPKVKVPESILNVNKVYKLYRGYKPSGLIGPEQGDLVSQMPGKIVKINIKVGDQVKKGQTIIVCEAMKMENELKANKDGIVKMIYVNQGQAIEQGKLLVEIE